MYTALQDTRQAEGTVDIYVFFIAFSIIENGIAMNFNSVPPLT